MDFFCIKNDRQIALVCNVTTRMSSIATEKDGFETVSKAAGSTTKNKAAQMESLRLAHDQLLRDVLPQWNQALASVKESGSKGLSLELKLQDTYSNWSKWTIWSGFWNDETHTHVRKLHHASGIHLLPKDILESVAYLQGYYVQWTSRVEATISPLLHRPAEAL